ncbi:hypothetical protein TL16_g07467 [Triparma laevis f. inornata]|nr:hypothetical protein TL16_g07467 [Triparma laevis f. inornata]
MQVLVSIQSLIFVDDPFYNEPGYDVKNKSLEKQSTKYNSQVRAATLRYGIMDVLKRRGGIWRPVIERHFRLR